MKKLTWPLTLSKHVHRARGNGWVVLCQHKTLVHYPSKEGRIYQSVKKKKWHQKYFFKKCSKQKKNIFWNLNRDTLTVLQSGHIRSSPLCPQSIRPCTCPHARYTHGCLSVCLWALDLLGKANVVSPTGHCGRSRLMSSMRRSIWRGVYWG